MTTSHTLSAQELKAQERKKADRQFAAYLTATAVCVAFSAIAVTHSDRFRPLEETNFAGTPMQMSSVTGLNPECNRHEGFLNNNGLKFEFAAQNPAHIQTIKTAMATGQPVYMQTKQVALPIAQCGLVKVKNLITDVSLKTSAAGLA